MTGLNALREQSKMTRIEQEHGWVADGCIHRLEREGGRACSSGPSGPRVMTAAGGSSTGS